MVTSSKFKLAATSDRFWNQYDFIKFLLANQGCAIELSMDPEAICLQNLGVYKLLELFDYKDVTIITSNPLEAHPIFKIMCLPNYWVQRQENINPNLHHWNQKKIFYALFGRPTASRLGIAAYLDRWHSSKSHVHFSTDLDVDNLIQFELDKLLSYRIKSVEDVGSMICKLPMLLSSPEKYSSWNGYDFSDPLTALYQDIFVDVVAESHVAGCTFFPTEKTFRSMWMKKPFIIFGSRDYLEYLRQMGFKTFYEYWPEDYDGYELGDRLSLTFELLDHLGTKSMQELDEMYQDMQKILDHNYNLLKTQKYTTRITKID